MSVDTAEALAKDIQTLEQKIFDLNELLAEAEKTQFFYRARRELEAATNPELKNDLARKAWLTEGLEHDEEYLAASDKVRSMKRECALTEIDLRYVSRLYNVQFELVKHLQFEPVQGVAG